ncbi:dihydroorotate oxidase, partial [Candidatus Gottesmanbacteria bacterium]|nr:dihydroorotate oxidase [Candidatus Gottesmanbacteria bacterium]
MQIPFYDPTKTYDENYQYGPYGVFVDGKNYHQSGNPAVDFLGEKVYTPFGIPAGPLINSAFCKSAFEKGFDICVYKTVRSAFYPCHPFPNILSVKIDRQLTLEKAKNKLIADGNFQKPISITN